MPDTDPRPLRVFLCHASQDKPAVRELCQRLAAEGWIDPWLDEEKLTFGQHWTTVIEEALAAADVVVIFLSKNSVHKEGFVQRELNYAWELSLEKPRGVIFLIPFRLDECEVPRYLGSRQWGDYFGERKESTYRILLRSLKERHRQKVELEAEERVRAEAAARQRVEEEARLEAEGRARREAEEKARLEREAQERREAEEQARLEREAREKRKAEEQARLAAEEKARRERETREKQAAEARDRLAREERARKEEEKTDLPEAPVRSRTKSASPRWLVPALMTGGVLALVVICGMGINYIAKNWPGGPEATPTHQAVIKTSTLPVITDIPTSTLPVIPVVTPELGIIGSTQTSEKDGMTLLYVPAGEFRMGSDNGGDDEKPVHTVSLEAFWIDQTEVTNGMYALCVRAGACDPPDQNKSNTRDSYYGNSEFEDYPVIYVSWNDAGDYCAWAGRRLPTEAEWEKAASWDEARQEKRKYPWGDSIDCSFANYWGKDGGCSGDTSKVGSYPSGASPYGALDMAGNVWEWVLSLYKPYPYMASDGRDALSANGTRVLRGGAWNDLEYDVRSASRLRYGPVDRSGGVGFRCALSP